MPLMRRGPGLVGTAARTAVVMGTAGRVAHRQQRKFAEQDAGAQQAPPPETVPATPAAAGEPDYMAELAQLAQLRGQGILTPRSSRPRSGRTPAASSCVARTSGRRARR